jgi:uncharacterized protein
MIAGKTYHFLFFLGHPAHFHMFRPMIGELTAQGHRVSIIARPKDVLMDLLKSSGLSYHEVPGGSRKPGLGGILGNLRQKASYLYKYCKENPPDIMLGTSAEIAWVGRLQGIPSLVFSEDDASVIPYFAWLAYPFATAVISPEGCNNGRWQKKTIAYPGYQKLAYLHPARFKPDWQRVRKYIPGEGPYSILRFSGLLAHHDRNASGFDTETALKTIEILSQKGKVFISSELPLESALEPYRLRIDPADMHQLLAHAALFAGDSQSMTVEAALLGVPSFRLSSFKGKISVLEELEHHYGLTRAFDPEHASLLLEALHEFTFSDKSRDAFRKNREKLLADKCDVTDFYLKTALRYLKK